MASPSFRSASAVVGFSAGSSPASITQPTGTASGDLLVLFWFLAAHGGTGSGRTPPTDFVLLDAVPPTNDFNGWAIYAKVAGGSEPSSYSLSQTSNSVGADRAFIAAWSGAYAASPIDAVGTKYSDDATTTPDVLSFAAATAETTLVALAVEWSTANRVIGVSSSGTTQRTQFTTSPSFLVADLAVASPGAIGLKQFSSDFNGYFFTFPRANLSSVKTNMSGKDQDQMLDVTFSCVRDAANADPALRKVMFIDRVGAAVT